LRQRSRLILNISTAGLFWLLGQSFLLTPPAMLPLTISLAAWLYPLLGGLGNVIALATGFALFASARMRQFVVLQLLILAMLGILASLFILNNLLIEGFIIEGTRWLAI